jgi:hypothetical protein
MKKRKKKRATPAVVAIEGDASKAYRKKILDEIERQARELIFKPQKRKSREKTND